MAAKKRAGAALDTAASDASFRAALNRALDHALTVRRGRLHQRVFARDALGLAMSDEERRALADLQQDADARRRVASYFALCPLEVQGCAHQESPETFLLEWVRRAIPDKHRVRLETLDLVQELRMRAPKDAAKKRRPKARTRDLDGVSALQRAYDEWIWEAPNRSPKDAAVLQVADVLLALLRSAQAPNSAPHAEMLVDLATVARRHLRLQVIPEGELVSRDKLMHAPTVLAAAEDLVRRYVDEHTEAARWRVAGCLVADLQVSRLYGPPAGTPEEAHERVKIALDRREGDDSEAVVRAVLVAYGVPADKARNAFKYRDVHNGKTTSSG